MSQAGAINNSGGGGAGVTSVTGTNGVTAAPTTGAVVVSGVNATTSSVGVASFNPTEFTVTAGAVSLIGGAGEPAVQSLSDDSGTAVFPTGTPENIQLVGHVNEQGATKFSTIVAGTNLLNINPMTTARWIVDPLGFNGTHTNITAAIASATSGDTIFIMPGTYSESPTLKAGVDLSAAGSDSSLNATGNVTINGTVTFSGVGSVTLSGIELNANSLGYALVVSGNSASIMNLYDCFLNCAQHTGVLFSSSSSSAAINFYDCEGNIATTGISCFTSTSPGALVFNNATMNNSGLSTTASTTSSGVVTTFNAILQFPITTSSTGTVNFVQTEAGLASLNITAITLAGTGTSSIAHGVALGGTASAISIGTGTTCLIYGAMINSSNTNAITGAGTVNYQGLTFTNTSSTINTTTQTTVGTLQGSKNTAPSAGFLGEQIRSAIATGSAQGLSTNTPLNVTSINLTAGIWDVSGIVSFKTSSNPSASFVAGSISTTSATLGTEGDNSITLNSSPTTLGGTGLSIPSYRLTLTTTTTVYLVADSTFGAGNISAFGRISGTRVG